MFAHYNNQIKGILYAAYTRLAPEIAAQLEQVVTKPVTDAFTKQILEHAKRLPSCELDVHVSMDGCFSESYRRASGMYYTPEKWARFMAGGVEFLSVSSPVTALDLSAGDGSLLLALAQKYGAAVHVRGVELEVASAMFAALRLMWCRQQQGVWNMVDQIAVGVDGLSCDVDHWLDGVPVHVVVGNPPYLGEKGNRAFFDDLFERHEHLVRWRTKRLDLLYLFLIRGAQLLTPGGVMVHMTSAYWLQAQGAQHLRDYLREVASPVLFWSRPGERLFKDAPGHHSLVSVYQKKGGGEAPENRAYACEGEHGKDMDLLAAYNAGEPALELELDSGGLRPFVGRKSYEDARDYRLKCARLSSLFKVCQGFVSGADVVSKRHLKILESAEVEHDLGHGDAVYLFASWDAVPEELMCFKGEVIFPVLRGSLVVNQSLMLEAAMQEQMYALYVDAPLEEGTDIYDAVCTHLSVMKPVLSARREVKMGRIPWYRMHWPRSREEQLGPKLVMARRDTTWKVGLDCGQHVVSSDCTYITHHEERRRKFGALQCVRELARVMTLLNQPQLRRDLHVYGKQKGELYEFYSEPVGEVPLALVTSGTGEYIFDTSVLGDAHAGVLEQEVQFLIEGLDEDTLNASIQWG